MKIRFSSDIYEDSGLDDLIGNLRLSKYFIDKNYGNEDVEIFFVINCIGENTKLRKKYDSKSKVLYWDVILSYEKTKKATIDQKKVMLANTIISSFDILDDYKKLNIDKEALKKDCKSYFVEIGWLPPLTIV